MRRETVLKESLRSGVTVCTNRTGRVGKNASEPGREFVIPGWYIHPAETFDSIFVGRYEGRDLMYAVRVRAASFQRRALGYSTPSRGLEIGECPFKNVPEARKGRWGEGLTAEDMKKCRWLERVLVALLEFLEWTREERLRHPEFVAMQSNMRPVETGASDRQLIARVVWRFIP